MIRFLRPLVIAAGFSFALAACSTAPPVATATPPIPAPPQVVTVQTDVGKVAAAVESVCGDALGAAQLASPFSLIPQVAGVLTFVNASCGSADAIAALTVKAVNDPSTVAWAEGLATMLKSDVAALKTL